MRATASTFAGCILLLLCGCGYVGPVVPPSPQIPSAVTDLSAVESGADIVITFTTPARTLDNLAIRKFSTIEVRVGTDTQPLDLNQWAGSAKEFDLPLPPENEKDVARPMPMTLKIPVSEWSGQRIAVAVRTAIKNDRNYSNWSNVQRLEVIPPLAAPKLSVTATARGYKLTWTDEGAGVSYEVFRQGAGDQPATVIGTSDKAEYVDSSSLYDTPYIYSVTAKKGSTQSPMSNRFAVNAHDIFAPAVPLGLTGIATGDAIELSWERNPEADLQGYFVYRSVNGGAFEQQGSMINLPAFTDRNVQHGVTYRYSIAAIDRTGNASEKSAAIEVRFP